MKGPWKLALVHLLVAMTLFGYSASKGVKVYCSLTWFQVNFQALTIGDWYLLPDEVFLGHGCPVTNVLRDVYVFLYPTSDCEIETWIANGKIIFKTSLTFISKTSPRQGIMPVSCTIQQDKPVFWPAGVYIHPRPNHWLLRCTKNTMKSISNAHNYVFILRYLHTSLSMKTNEVKEAPNHPMPDLIFHGKWKLVT